MVNLLFISIIYSASGANCYGISLGGGGAFGAYQAGSFAGLINNLPSNQVLYDVISGISVGSLNGGAISQFPIGQEKPASDFVLNIYQTFNGSQTVYKDWPGGLLDGLFFHSGIYDTSPEYTFINNNFHSPPQRKITLGSTNIELGEFQVFNESLSFADLKHAAMCSSAISFFF